LASKRPDGPPAPDVIEVSIFGPGRGECCLLHIGEGEWVIVDSCLNARTGANPALEYLGNLGVSPDAVKMIVATHAHDDHFAGIASVVAACTKAEFVASTATTHEEFFALVEFDEDISRLIRPSSYSEYRRINEILMARRAASGRRGKIARTWAMADRPIYRRSSDNGTQALITALSPSDEAVTRAKASLARLLPTSHAAGDGQPPAGPPRRRLPPEDPNHFAVALWVLVEDIAVLLGADLLRGPGIGGGWNAVLASAHRPGGRAEVFKVPHHGSPNAHHDDVWKELVVDNAIAILAPYRRGSTPRPAPEDAARICSLTNRAYATASSRSPSPPARVRKARASLEGVARKVREPDGTPGQVRARRGVSDPDWTIELFGHAMELAGLAG
jgi:Metallo-beta-lactamase superfamily